jgi:16S rRNA (cytidine1402-2'-O)-methyltransferase
MKPRDIESTAAWEEDRLIGLSGVAQQDWPTGALYVVATPIGNAADITLRALWVLAYADAIAAEDTRITRQLLARYEIASPKHGVFAAHAHNERAAGARVIELLAGGARVTLVTDAGTPAVSDPGARVVRAAREAGYRVIPIPGASSALAALSAAGFAEGGFSFIGFPPTGAKTRARFLAEAAARGDAFVLFEAPHRVTATLRDLAHALPPERRVLIARELSKMHETLTMLPAAELPSWAAQHEARGEYVVAVDAAPASDSARVGADDALTRRWLAAIAEELPPAKAAAIAVRVTGHSRSEMYRIATAGASLREPRAED